MIENIGIGLSHLTAEWRRFVIIDTYLFSTKQSQIMNGWNAINFCRKFLTVFINVNIVNLPTRY
jgi:hypothetical protein